MKNSLTKDEKLIFGSRPLSFLCLHDFHRVATPWDFTLISNLLGVFGLSDGFVSATAANFHSGLTADLGGVSRFFRALGTPEKAPDTSNKSKSFH